jgi:anti-anti-sigma factor
MDNLTSQVLYASRDGVHCLRFVGDIRYALAPSVNRFVDDLFRTEVPQDFVIDLTQTRIIDSTSLGVIARIANHMHEHGAPRVTIVSTRHDVTEILLTMGFDEVFDIVTEPPAVPAVKALPVEEADRDSLARTVVEAHRILMSLNECNRELFRDLVAVLERENGVQGS